MHKREKLKRSCISRRDQSGSEGDVEGKQVWNGDLDRIEKIYIFFHSRSCCLKDIYRWYAFSKATGISDGSVLKNLKHTKRCLDILFKVCVCSIQKVNEKF